jgi:hypothetical protein
MHSRRIEPMNLSQMAFARGASNGVLISLIPLLLATVENSLPCFLSLSRVRYQGRLPQGVASRSC